MVIRQKMGVGLKMALLTSIGLFIVLSLLFHLSFSMVEDNILSILKGSDEIHFYYAESIKKTISNNRLLFILSTLSSIVISVGVVMLFFHRLIKNPLNGLIKTIEEIEGGNLDALVPVKGSDEIALLSEKFNTMLGTVREMQRKVIHEYVNEKISIVDSISIGVIIVSQDTKKVLFANTAALKILGVRFEDLQSKDFAYTITPGIIKEFRIDVQGSLPVMIEMRCISINWQKTAAHMVLLIDVTRLKTVETELREAKEKAEAATVAKSLFLANMSHEIRTPMNAILGMTDIIMETDLTAEQKGYLNTIRGAAESLLRIINDILDLSKIESGKIELEKVHFYLDGLVDENLSLFYSQALKKGIALTKDIEQDVPVSLKGDPLRLKQVFYNLIGNAIKFTHKGEIKVIVRKVRSGQVSKEGTSFVTLKDPLKDKVMLLFCVKDTGIGIPYALQEKVFDSFTQADDSITRRYGGTGLGLTICKEIVKLMDGTIWVESEPNIGSSFYFTALFELYHDQATQEISHGVIGYSSRECHKDKSPVGLNETQGAIGPEGQATGISVLVAEDDKMNQNIISLILKKRGFDFAIAENGHEVLARLQREHFDIILMDVQMPDMDGLEATRRIRASKSGPFDPDIPIIAVTAFALKEDMQRCLEAGMDEHISKPIKADRLMEVIYKLAKDKGLSRQV